MTTVDLLLETCLVGAPGASATGAADDCCDVEGLIKEESSETSCFSLLSHCFALIQCSGDSNMVSQIQQL